MPDKLLVRVEQAVERGVDTSSALASCLHANQDSINAALLLLFRSGRVVREKACRGTGGGSGRATYRYRVVAA